MKRIYTGFTILIIILCAYVLGFLYGFVVGYNDVFVEKIAKYRVLKRR